MINELPNLLREQNIFFHKSNGVLICKVANQQKGFDLASQVLYTIVDKKSVLYLSGGKTPKELYAKLAKEENLKPGAVGMIDERYGKKLHENSNEKMIREAGLLRYLEMLDIPFYPILQAGISNFICHSERSDSAVEESHATRSKEQSQWNEIPPLHSVGRDDKAAYCRGLGREETAAAYDEKFRFLLSTFPKHIGILGIGEDGHTAGVPAGSQISNLKSQISKVYATNDLVVEYNDEGGKYGERVTMSFMGLTMLDILLVLVFGQEKRKALELVFNDGSEEEAPGRFYKRPEIAQKTLLITDQEM